MVVVVLVAVFAACVGEGDGEATMNGLGRCRAATASSRLLDVSMRDERRRCLLQEKGDAAQGPH